MRRSQRQIDREDQSVHRFMWTPWHLLLDEREPAGRTVDNPLPFPLKNVLLMGCFVFASSLSEPEGMPGNLDSQSTPSDGVVPSPRAREPAPDVSQVLWLPTSSWSCGRHSRRARYGEVGVGFSRDVIPQSEPPKLQVCE